ncbi:glutathione S-transferase family protein [Mesorhizobium sp. BAC0120]|uniref:glutathione S-transferase family protein n=1 Tax=Mesorhizobium sp. BAC0120 TaxID=3090670 RepID=UPI00298C13B4|nr:glutathione S-transferase family protein [Mesorhizobium sp. BAC0120]MDW6026596.1 glutathione S-transferase family protein [Mesorhizobium sp. BAC0120]
MSQADLSKPILYGADYSVYVRIARLVLVEKQVDYELVPVDVFAEGGPPAQYLERQPFGRIPAFEHDGFRIYETAAITRYVDEAFPGPTLQPAEPCPRALMNQILGIVDSYAYRTLVWDLYVETVSKPRDGGKTDEARVARALPVAETCLAELARLKRHGEWLLGDAVTLADLYLAPVFGYFEKAAMAAPMLARHPALAAWWERVKGRESIRTTEPTI